MTTYVVTFTEIKSSSKHSVTVDAVNVDKAIESAITTALDMYPTGAFVISQFQAVTTTNKLVTIRNRIREWRTHAGHLKSVASDNMQSYQLGQWHAYNHVLHVLDTYITTLEQPE